MMIERRTFATPIEYRAHESGDIGIRGLAARFYDGSEGTQFRIMPKMVERVAPGAFDGVIQSDVVGLFNHNDMLVLGRTGAGTMTIRVTNQGLEYDIPSLPASRADVGEMVQRRDVGGSSIGFVPDLDRGIRRSMDGDVQVITIERVSMLRDLGPATFPAYTGSTSEQRCGYLPDIMAQIATRAELVEWREMAAERLAALTEKRLLVN